MGKKHKIEGGPDVNAFQPFDSEGNLTVIIETPKGSRNKYAYDEQHHIFQLKKVLPEGMVFPHDFGFVPSTKADDGDPVDVLVLMDQPAFTGCALQSRVVGVIEGEQQQDGRKIRNDRILAVACASHTHSNIHHVKDLNKNFLKEVETFFEAYHEQSGSRYKTLDYKGPKRALELLKKSNHGNARKKKK
jgi:inorganic pyrophosphatase